MQRGDGDWERDEGDFETPLSLFTWMLYLSFCEVLDFWCAPTSESHGRGVAGTLRTSR